MENFKNHILVTYDTDKNKEFKELIFEKLVSNYYNFEFIKRISESFLKDFTKIFIYKDNTIMPVAPIGYLPSGYYERVKSKNISYIDKTNKTILLLEI